MRVPVNSSVEGKIHLPKAEHDKFGGHMMPNED